MDLQGIYGWCCCLKGLSRQLGVCLRLRISRFAVLQVSSGAEMHRGLNTGHQRAQEKPLLDIPTSQLERDRSMHMQILSGSMFYIVGATVFNLDLEHEANGPNLQEQSSALQESTTNE
jgi:hypothetical protein